ncbi:hypothetical protein [Streptomyces cadmiisoli]|uniref:hypothetical protein n=1 Tax=Streptomyces cadmiisoli TaxID=2184053 RepID=UPI003D74F58F
MGGFSAEALGSFVAALALGASAWSVFYLAKQTKSGNAMAEVSANDSVLGALREVHLLMLERPGSRRYFYEGKPLPAQADEADERDAIITIAELLADVMTNGLILHAKVPESESAEPWEAYCRHTLESSPVLCELLRARPEWWPRLTELIP